MKGGKYNEEDFSKKNKERKFSKRPADFVFGKKIQKKNQ